MSSTPTGRIDPCGVPCAPMKCKLVPCSQAAYDAYRSWAQLRNFEVPPPHGAGGWIMIAFEGSQGLHLISGAWLSFGPDFALLGGFLCAPGLSPRMVRACAGSTLSFAAATAGTLGKQLRAQPLSKSQLRLLIAQGFKVAGAALPGMMFCGPTVEFDSLQAPKRSPRAYSGSRAPEPAGNSSKPTGNRKMRRAAAAAKRS